MTPDFNYAMFHRRRKRRKVVGLVLILVGLFILLNMMGEIPEEPLKGVSAIFFGTVLILLGFLALYHGYKLPLEETLDLIHDRGRGVTESELVHEMRVDRPTARRIIDGLIRKGFLRRSTDQGSQTEEVFEPVR